MQNSIKHDKKPGAKPRKNTKPININGRRNEGEWKKETYGKGSDVHAT